MPSTLRAPTALQAPRASRAPPSPHTVLRQLLLPVILWAAVVTSAGRRAAERSAGPLAVLYASIPIWDHAIPLLQAMAARRIDHRRRCLSAS